MDTVLNQLIEARKAAVAERDLAAEKVRALDKLIQEYQESISTKKSAKQADLFSAVPRTRSEKAAAVARMMDVAEELIIAAQRPLTRSELLEELQARGHTVEGSDRSKVLGTNIWRSNRFLSLKGLGYWPKRVPLPDELRTAEQRGSMLD